MKKEKSIFQIPEENSEKLTETMRRVKDLVKRYQQAKQEGKLRRTDTDSSAQLFNV
jgi:hypothetical protein